jgi:FkbM family methyltransferase
VGVKDLVVTEAIWRLVRPGDTVLDVGANVGYMSLVAAARMGLRGHVFAFEAHPQLFDELPRNASRACTRFPGVTVTPRREELSDSVGMTWLHVPKEFAQKRGLSSIS